MHAERPFNSLQFILLLYNLFIGLPCNAESIKLYHNPPNTLNNDHERDVMSRGSPKKELKGSPNVSAVLEHHTLTFSYRDE